jgi:cystathionine beta-lyase/cystathionine gamma-synthase
MAEFLSKHPAIEKVYYPFHPEHPGYEIARKQMTGAGGLLSFTLNTTDPDKIERFANGLKAFLLACSWGSYESLCFPAAAMVQSANYHNSPFPPNLFRIYCGLEESDVLIADIRNAIFLSGI